MSLAHRCYDLLMSHHLVALGLLLLGTIGVAAGLARFEFDNSYTQWFVDDDPALLAYHDFVDSFGSDEVVLIGVETLGDPLAEETLQAVEAVSAAFADHPEVREVWSLTRAETLEFAGGALRARSIVEEIPPSAEDRAWLAGELEHGAVASDLVSEDGTITLVLLMLEPTGESFDPKMALVREVRDALPELAPGRRTWLAGGTVIDEAFFGYSERDSMLYAPLMAGVVVVMLGLVFRSPVAVLLPLVVIGAAVIWALGFMSWMGWSANVSSTVLPPVLAAVGVADSVHLLQQYRLAARQAPLGDALRTAFVRVFRPCLLTTITTASGMAALSAAQLSGIRELGLTAAVGVVAALLWTLVALPIALDRAPAWALGGLRSTRPGPVVPRSLVALARFATRHPWPVALAGAATVVLSVVGATRLQVGSSMSSYFWDEDPVYQQGLDIDRAFGGSLPVEVLVEPVGAGSLLEPQAMQAMEAVAGRIESWEATGSSISAVDFLREARRVLREEPHGTRTLPATRAEAAQLLLLLEGDAELGRYLTLDHRQGRISAPVEMGRYEVLVDDIEGLDADLREAAGGAVEVRITGLARLMAGMETYLVDSQVRTFSLAFALVLGCFALMFRSWRAGLLSVVPNLFPLVVVLGIMGWAGVPLDTTTVMIAPLLLGLVVDDTVHVLERVLHARHDGEAVDQAFVTAVGEVGHAVLITSAILAAGFLCPALGSFKPNFFFAVLSFVAIGLALLGDLVLLPAVGVLVPGLVRGR